MAVFALASDPADLEARLGRIVQSGFHYHYARLIEILYALERIDLRVARAPAPDAASRA